MAEGDAAAFCLTACRTCHDQPDEALKAVAVARRLVSSSRVAGPDTLRLLERCSEAAAWACTRLCRLEEAERELGQAREMASRLREARALAECELIATALATLRGDLISGAQCAQRALVAYERLGDVTGLARSRSAAGLVSVHLGDLRSALQSFEAARVEAEQAGDARTASSALGHLGRVYLQLGHAGEAEQTLRRALDACLQSQNRRGAADVLTALGDLYCAQGQHDEAFRCLEEAGELSAQLKDPAGASLAHVHLIRARARAGDWTGARREFEIVEGLVRHTGLRRAAINAKFEFAQSLLTQAAVADAPDGPGLNLMKDALVDAQAAGHRLEQSLIHEALWRYHKRHGHMAEALLHHEELSRLRSEILTSEAQAQAARARIQFELERSHQEAELQRQKVQELSVLNAEIERQRQATEGLTAELQEKVRALEAEMGMRHKAEEERLVLERQMMETQKLDSLGVLASAIAHDFNNLLTVIVGSADLARMRNAHNSALLPSLDSILSASARAASLCQQMLDFAGKGTAHRVPLVLPPLVKESIELASSAFGSTCTARSRLDPELPPVHGDPGQLRQVMVNLLLNAGEALGKNAGEVSVSVQLVMLDARRAARLKGAPNLAEGTYVCIEVADNGPGMPPEVLNRVFEPFFSTRFLGRGLGLPAALGIVRSHGGGIEMESSPGAGTRVRVFLPPITVEQPRRGGSTPPEMGAEWRARGAILIADDEATLRDVMEAACSQFGFEVITAADGAEALTLFRQHQHRIVATLLDFQMPHYDGAFICRRILQARPGLPVVLMSGFSEQEAITELTREHPDVAFLPKPFGIPKLRAILQATMSRVS